MTDFKDKFTVSKPDLPDFDAYVERLRDIWDRQHITNRGVCHQNLEASLATFLGCDNVSLSCNGTIALEVALRVLGVTGEVITTPFTFAATTHAIHINNCEPVFCDVDPETFCIDPEKLEACITPRTSAILAVHVYGRPCDFDAIEKIACNHGLKVIYDAAHGFGVRLPDGRSLLDQGHISTLSFHATKVFNTIEGGALICRDPQLKARIDRALNFGMGEDGAVVEAGTNGKMNELSAAWGLLLLEDIGAALEKRSQIAARYRENLADMSGLRLPRAMPGVESNHGYFPVLIEQEFGIDCVTLQAKLDERNILTRRYFYPLVSNMECYRGLRSAAPEQLPVANDLAEKVLCLPIYSTLALSDVDMICDTIAGLSD